MYLLGRVESGQQILIRFAMFNKHINKHRKDTNEK